MAWNAAMGLRWPRKAAGGGLVVVGPQAWAAKMEVSHDDSFSCYFSCCFVPWFLLGCTVVFSLLVCFSRKILQGRLLPERRTCPLSAGAWPKTPRVGICV